MVVEARIGGGHVVEVGMILRSSTMLGHVPNPPPLFKAQVSQADSSPHFSPSRLCIDRKSLVDLGLSSISSVGGRIQTAGRALAERGGVGPEAGQR